MQLVDAATGLPADPVLVDRNTGRPLDGPGFVMAAGPAASERTRERLERVRADAARAGGSVVSSATVSSDARRVPARGGRPRRRLRSCAGPWPRRASPSGWLPAPGTATTGGRSGRFLDSTDDAFVGGDIVARGAAGRRPRRARGGGRQPGRPRRRPAGAARRPRLPRVAGARRGAVAAAEAALANLDATRRLQEALVDEARAEVAAAEAEGERARADAERYRALARSSYASAQRQQQADADDRKAAADEAKTRAALAAAERRVEVIDTQKRQAAAALQQASGGARPRPDQPRLHRDPRPGRRRGRQPRRAGGGLRRGGRPAALARAGARPVGRRQLQGEPARRACAPARPATVVADVLPGETFAGRVASLAPATGAQFSVIPAENATGNFTRIVQRVPVRILLDGDGSRLGRLRPGLSRHRHRRPARPAQPRTDRDGHRRRPSCRRGARSSPSR